MFENSELFVRNDSRDSRQPAPTAGKVPHRFVGPNREEPSRRNVAPRLYPSRVFRDTEWPGSNPANTLPKMRSLVLMSCWPAQAILSGLVRLLKPTALPEAKFPPMS